MRPFDYIRPATIEEAIHLLGEADGGTQALAGGTDLLTLMKGEIAAPARLVNLKGLDWLPRGIEETERGVRLGALTTLSEVETSLVIRQRFPLLAEAAAVAATPQLRNMATVGGNLLQRPRCWYFRNSRFHCWLKGGEACPAYDGENPFHALFGGGPCYAVHPSDLAPALLALDAEVSLQGPEGERTLPLPDLFALPEPERRRETVIGSDELILSLCLPPLPAGTRGTYLKAMDRKVWAFALVGVAAVVQLAEPSDEGAAPRVLDARIYLGGVAPIPWRAAPAEQELIGAEVSEELIAQVAETALAGAEPLAHNAYKIPLAKSLVRRALATMLAE